MPMLLNTIEDLKAQIGGIQKQMFWATWDPYVRQAEMKYIIPAIGLALYDELTETAQPDPNQSKLLDRLKPAVAYFAYMEAFPFLVTATGDAGIVINAPANTVNITKWLYVTIGKDLLSKSDFWLENSLQWLESHADQFPTWVASDAYTVNRGRMIASASQFTKSFPAGKNSRRLFMAVRDHLIQAEEGFVKPILGEAFYQSLVSRLVSDPLNLTVTVEEAEVFRLCRLAIANHGMADALPYLSLNADMRIVSETDGIVNEDELDGPRIDAIREDCRTKAGGASGSLAAYLNEHASETVFPLYFTSARYSPPASGSSRRRIKNDSANPYFVI